MTTTIMIYWTKIKQAMCQIIVTSWKNIQALATKIKSFKLFYYKFVFLFNLLHAIIFVPYIISKLICVDIRSFSYTKTNCIFSKRNNLQFHITKLLWISRALTIKHKVMQKCLFFIKISTALWTTKLRLFLSGCWIFRNFQIIIFWQW